MKRKIPILLLLVFLFFPACSEKKYSDLACVEGNCECIEGDCINGSGKLKYHDGSVFEGKFVEGIPQNGIGTVYYNKNGEKAVGTFKHNTLNGYGIWHNKDNFGVTYEGEWKDRKIISEIAKTFSEGIITYGQYDGSGFNGLGIKVFEKEKQIYLGYLEWGLRTGVGAQFREGNELDDQMNYLGYFGEFYKGKRRGQGIELSSIEPEFKNGSWDKNNFLKENKDKVSIYAPNHNYRIENTTGCIEGDCINGIGTKIFTNYAKGWTYFGGFKNRNFSGLGILVPGFEVKEFNEENELNINWLYAGEWNNGWLEKGFYRGESDNEKYIYLGEIGKHQEHGFYGQFIDVLLSQYDNGNSNKDTKSASKFKNPCGISKFFWNMCYSFRNSSTLPPEKCYECIFDHGIRNYSSEERKEAFESLPD